MEFSAQWEELLADSPGGGQGTSGQGTRMNLASVAPIGGGGDADLQITQTPWNSASGVANALHTSTNSAVSELDTAAEGVPGGTAGFTSTAALEEVRTSWKTRLTSVRDECARLEGVLKTVGRDFGETDVQVRDSFGVTKTKGQ
ncbi:hypothetical protein GCM10020367_30270 [Streptomyces sannanensis]|uniref:Uncharacterized protein n=1 Tax=Streptomyces sannanensis TaxID=285536 RepID=A0ABP6SBN9_9ACTN